MITRTFILLIISGLIHHPEGEQVEELENPDHIIQIANPGKALQTIRKSCDQYDWYASRQKAIIRINKEIV